MHETPSYYAAYGSNLQLAQMARRCPTAVVFKTGLLLGYELLFRSRPRAFATIEPREGGQVPVLLWQLKPKDEEALDRYEEYPVLYRKEILPVVTQEGIVISMFYLMNPGQPFGEPTEQYYKTILSGYESAGFSQEILDAALEETRRRSLSQD